MKNKQQKDETKSNKLTWQQTTLYAIILLMLLAIILAFTLPIVKVGAKCEIKGIHYDNVCPNKCWSEQINCRFCPLPTDIACDLNGQAPIIKLIGMFR